MTKNLKMKVRHMYVCDTDMLTSGVKVCHIKSVTFPRSAPPADPGCPGNKMLQLHPGCCLVNVLSVDAGYIYLD